MRHVAAVRLGLALLALGQLSVGAWALLDPRGFYEDFPGGGQHWVAALPPFNEHLVRDVGAAALAFAVLAAVAAVLAQRTLTIVTASVLLVGAVPHLAFHAAHAGHGGAGSIVSLALTAALPLLLLVLVVPKEHP
jgi:hypothetical protein